MDLFHYCAACGHEIPTVLDRPSSGRAAVVIQVELCIHCVDEYSNLSYDDGKAKGFAKGFRAGRDEAEAKKAVVQGYSERDLEEAIRGALEEGKAEGYSQGLIDGRELEREGK